jgi:2-polyprenyl-6-methoxyphenol hydroxylase-like FAD-dependent oxidoreductase
VTRVLVIGGGIAGTATALALDKAGIDATIYEAYPSGGEDIGAFLTLASNGMRALAQVDAAAPVAAAGFGLTTLRVVAATGAEVANVPMGDHDDPLTRFRCLRRAGLCATLQAEAERRGIAIRYGSRLESVTENDDGVTARFGDGSTARGDLVVGADGLGSTVRTLIDPAATPPRYAGQRVFYGYTTDAAPPSAPGRIDMIRGGTTAFGYAVSPGGETFWFAREPGAELTADEIAGTGPGQWRDHLVPLLRADATPAADIVAATGDELMVTNARDLLDAKTRWHNGRVLIVGDAAHAASPATGQGASMAFEDAIVLAKALRDADTIETALRSYESVRRPRVERNIANSAELSADRTPNRGQRPPAPPSAAEDEELARQLDWAVPLVT